MITLTCILVCAIETVIVVFILSRLICHFIEKTLVVLNQKVFSLPENILDSIKEKFNNKGKLPEAVEVKE